jgi:Flp pilus assembly protein TadG
MNMIRDEGGQSLLEMAILAPFLLLLTIGIIDIGRYTFVAVAVANSARAGAEYGSQNLATTLDYTGMQTAAQNDAGSISGFTVSGTSMCVCSDGTASTCLPTDCSSSHRLTYVSVTSSATINALIKYPGIDQPITIQRTVKMQVS